MKYFQYKVQLGSFDEHALTGRLDRVFLPHEGFPISVQTIGRIPHGPATLVSQGCKNIIIIIKNYFLNHCCLNK